MTARVLGVPKATLGNWIRASDKGDLRGAGDKPVSPEQMELARLRAELARVKMERDILKKATAHFAKGPMERGSGRTLCLGPSALSRERGRDACKKQMGFLEPSSSFTIFCRGIRQNKLGVVR